MSAEIRQIVARTWKEHIGVPQEWSTEQTEEFFTAEATRMADRISRMQAEQQLVVIRQWRHAHNGDQPDYLTQVGLINSARAQCQEIVLSQELYEQIPDDLDAVEQAEQEEYEARYWEEQTWCRLPQGNDPESVSRRTDPDRWKGVYRSPATEEVEDAVKAVWPEQTIPFWVLMGLLWQSRVEDGKPVPSTVPLPRTQLRARRANEALKDEMAQLVNADLNRYTPQHG